MNSPYAVPPASSSVQFPAPAVRPARAPWLAAQVAVGGLLTCALVDLASSLFVVLDYEQFLGELRSGVVSERGFAQIGLEASGVLYFVVLAFTAVAFITWLYQARSNVDRLNSRANWGKGWSIGGWFIPLANLVIPAKVVADVREASTPYVPGRPAVTVKDAPVAAWWTAWVLVFVLERIWMSFEKMVSAKGDPTLAAVLADRPVTYALLFLGSAALVAAAAFGAVVVLRITRAQEETAANQIYGASGAVVLS